MEGRGLEGNWWQNHGCSCGFDCGLKHSEWDEGKVAEEAETLKKKNNIVSYILSEGSNHNTQERNAENKTYCLELLKEVLKVSYEEVGTAMVGKEFMVQERDHFYWNLSMDTNEYGAGECNETK